jgi:hypothetical protein
MRLFYQLPLWSLSLFFLLSLHFLDDYILYLEYDEWECGPVISSAGRTLIEAIPLFLGVFESEYLNILRRIPRLHRKVTPKNERGPLNGARTGEKWISQGYKN